MSRMNKNNLDNIKDIFEKRTGIDLRPETPHPPMRKLVALAAAIICCFALAAFTYPLFTPLDGDELTLSAAYEGDGIISIFVENGSKKELEFQKKTKLIPWVTGEEVERLDGEVIFENTTFPAHSCGIMTVDLSKAYDIEALEGDGRNYQSYYLLLTNNDFLFGHDWMCSFTFEDKHREEPDETQPHVAAQNVEQIEESLRFYFEDSYQDDPLAWNEKNFTYLQKVDEMIKRFDGNVVSPVYPMIMVTGPSTFLDPQPSISENMEGLEFDDVPAEGLVAADWTIADGYRRLVGAAASEKTLTVSAHIPLKEFYGVSAIPLIYTFVYETETVQNKEDDTFFYGQFHSFEELEKSKVYEDEHYAIYDVTDYFYTDLDAYIDYVEQVRPDLRIDAQIRRQIRMIYDYYRDHLGDLVYYPVLQ